MYIVGTLQEIQAFDSACANATREMMAITNIIINGSNHFLDSTSTPTTNHTMSVEITDVASGNDAFRIGTFGVNECVVKLHFDTADPFSQWLTAGDTLLGKWVSIEFDIYGVTGNSWYGIPLGIFCISNVEVSNDGRDYTLTAYSVPGSLLEEADFDSLGVTFPCTAQDILDAIASHCNVSIVTVNAMTTFTISSPVKGTYRDYIGWMFGLIGENARTSRVFSVDNKPYITCLPYTDYNNYGFTVSRGMQHLDGLNKKYDGTITYTDIISGTEEAPMHGTGRSGNAIVLQNPFMTQSILDNLCTDLLGANGLTVIPCDLKWRGNPRLDACDIITVEDYDGTTFDMYVMEHTLSITGGMTDDAHSYGATEESLALNSSTYLDRFQQIASDISNLQNDVSTLDSNKANIVNETLNNPSMNWGLGSNTDITTGARAELRRSGSAGSYGVAMVVYDANNNSTFNTFVGSDGTFMPTYKLIKGIQQVTVSTSSSIADKGTATLTGTISTVSGASDYYFIPRYLNYGIFTSAVTRNNTSISVSAMNVSGASHTMTGSVLVIAI